MKRLLTDPDWHWQSIDDTVVTQLQPDKGYKSLIKEHDLCLTGEVSNMSAKLTLLAWPVSHGGGQ